MTVVERHRTAMARTGLSKPIALALSDGLITTERSVFDYGCGRGGDVQRLSALGYDIVGWDPAHAPHVRKRQADVVNIGYVVNVIEDPTERSGALREAWSLARQVLVVAARPDWEARSIRGRPVGDGIITVKGTFQKFYRQEELRAWIEQVLRVRSITAAPGIFYAFRDESHAQGFLAARVRHRVPTVRRPGVSEALYEANRDILDPLTHFVLERGRLPEGWEMAQTDSIKSVFGSIRAAFSVVRRAAGDQEWEKAQHTARQDLLVYLALAAFTGRPKFKGLPEDVQLDVRALYGTYKSACEEADQILFAAGNQGALNKACSNSPLGKLTAEALYVHVSAVATLDPLLRVYEGCGRALTGAVNEATLVKLNRLQPKVSYLAYPDFDRDPHPALHSSLRADLRRLHVKYQDFSASENPPILHRKEYFVPDDYPGRAKFARLTAQEERAGVLDAAEGIGTRVRWQARLEEKGFRLSGHRLVKDPAAASPSAFGPRQLSPTESVTPNGRV